MFYDNESEYKELLPDIFDGVVEIDVLHNSITVQLDKLNQLTNDGIDDKSISHATEQGLARWEKLLNVSAPLDATIQARRNALRAKLMTKPPINLVVLKNLIETYMGLEVDISVDGYSINVKYRGVSKIEDLKPLYTTVHEAIPASMIMEILYAFVTYLEEKQRFKTYAEQKGYTYAQIKRGEF